MFCNDSAYQFSADEAVEKWRSLIENDQFLLATEFHKLLSYDPNRAKVAKQPVNAAKNRYSTVYPYDEDFCRVTLKEEFRELYRSDSDYINASIVCRVPPDQMRSSTSRKFFAAQGPTEKTIDDFLRMIVEQKIDIIVMLSCPLDPITQTFTREHAPYMSEKVKTEVETEFFKVRTESIHYDYCYIGRHLRISSKVTNREQFCDHYHYVHFIDKSIPSDCYTLLGLVRRLNNSANQQRNILVHCSAGIGRTGVFITLYYLVEDIHSKSTFNIKSLVDTMRIYRPHLVQTQDQYGYIYRCLAQLLIHPPDGRNINEFFSEYHLASANDFKENHQIQQSFQNRNDRVEHPRAITTVAGTRYRLQNRNQNYIPYDHNRVILHSPSLSMYINASYVMNIIKPTGIILTQEPMQPDFQSFFSMLLQEHKKFIVSVESFEQNNYTTSPFDGEKGISSRPVPVKPTKNKVGLYFNSYQLDIKYETLRESSVFVYEYTGKWKNDGLVEPENLEHFVRFIDRSIYHQQKMDPNRLGLVVHDRIGGTKAAFYCIAQNLIDRLLIDNRIAIENFTTVLCQQRMNALISVEQYYTLHRLICIWFQLRRRGALLTSCE